MDPKFSKTHFLLAGCAIVGASLFSGLATAQSPSTCAPIVTKGGLRLPAGCSTAPSNQPTTFTSSSLGAGATVKPTTIGSGSIEGVVLTAPNEDQVDEATDQTELSLAPVDVDPVGIIEPISAPAVSRDFAGLSLGGGAALMGRSFLYNGVGGTTSPDTFGYSLESGQAILGVNGGLNARFGNFFARGSGFYGFLTDSWEDPGTIFALANGTTAVKLANSSIAIEGALIRGNLAGGYVFELSEGLGLDVGPSVVFVSQQATLTADDGTLTLNDARTATTTAVGLMGGVSVAPQPNSDFAFWGNAAVHGLYGFGGMTLSQTVNGGTALTQADIPTANISEGQTITFMGELDANVGYRLEDGLHIGGGVYANYLNDMAIIENYNLTSTSLLDFGAKVSVSLGF